VDVATFHPTEALKTLLERRDAHLPLGITLGQRNQDADATHPAALLRPGCKRPRRRTAKQRDEFAASDESCHLIPPAGRAREG
jgi:hypothetical protein